MHLAVQDLRNFYYRSALGRAAQHVIRNELLTYWPEAKGQAVLGYGFAVPLLRPYLHEARRVTGLMPGPQGVMAWPAGMPNVSVLCEEANWPVETGHVDKLVLMHGLETSEQPALVLEEAARVLGPGGSAVFIVPNRAGVWSRRDATPFGFGRPYSNSQLNAQLVRSGFQVERSSAVLYQPPSHQRFWLRTGAMIEQVGKKLAGPLSAGVLIVEATKHSRMPTGLGQTLTSRSSTVLGGLTQPEVKPA